MKIPRKIFLNKNRVNQVKMQKKILNMSWI